MNFIPQYLPTSTSLLITVLFWPSGHFPSFVKDWLVSFLLLDSISSGCSILGDDSFSSLIPGLLPSLVPKICCGFTVVGALVAQLPWGGQHCCVLSLPFRPSASLPVHALHLPVCPARTRSVIYLLLPCCQDCYVMLEKVPKCVGLCHFTLSSGAQHSLDPVLFWLLFLQGQGQTWGTRWAPVHLCYAFSIDGCHMHAENRGCEYGLTQPGGFPPLCPPTLCLLSHVRRSMWRVHVSVNGPPSLLLVGCPLGLCSGVC